MAAPRSQYCIQKKFKNVVLRTVADLNITSSKFKYKKCFIIITKLCKKHRKLITSMDFLDSSRITKYYSIAKAHLKLIIDSL